MCKCSGTFGMVLKSETGIFHISSYLRTTETTPMNKIIQHRSFFHSSFFFLCPILVGQYFDSFLIVSIHTNSFDISSCALSVLFHLTDVLSHVSVYFTNASLNNG